MINRHQSTQSKIPANSLLSGDQDFALHKANSFGGLFNVTYRAPRVLGAETVTLVCTSSVDVTKLNALRVESLDGKAFVVNDDAGYHSSFRISVTSEAVGHAIVKALIDAASPKEAAPQPEDLIEGVPYALRKAQKVASAFSELICIICFVALTVSGSSWLLTH